jgi:Mg-chelatase subunit ChlD
MVAAAERREHFERPVAVCLVADVSGSMAGEKLAAAKVGMSAFLGHLSNVRGDAIGLVAFSDEASVLVPVSGLSEFGDAVGYGIAALEASGNTALIDAILLGWGQLQGLSRHVCAVVVLTDGLENSSTVPVDEAARKLQIGDHRPMIFGLAYGQDADLEVLQRFAEITNGAALQGTVSNISFAYAEILRKI